MIALEPVDPAEFILAADKNRQDLLARNFSEISLDEAANPEVLDPNYEPIAFLENLQAEHLDILNLIWRAYDFTRLTFQNGYIVPPIDAAGDLAALEKAYKDASRRTLWEKVTKTNHKDVAEYKAMLNAYSERLLDEMYSRFSDAVFRNIRQL